MRAFSAICVILSATILSGPRAGMAHVPDPCADLVTWPLYVSGEPAEAAAARMRANPGEAEEFIYSRPPLGLGFDGDVHGIDLLTGMLRLLHEDSRAFAAAVVEEPADEVTPDQQQQLQQQPVVRRLAGDAIPNELRGVVVPEQLLGIAGFSTALFLQKVLPLGGDPIADKIFMGKIRDYIFDDETKSGHLSVDSCTDVIGFVPLGEDRREYFHWDIEIVENGYVVNQRKVPTDTADPNTYGAPFQMVDVVLPAFSSDPADPRSIWRRGLDHKLHSAGPWMRITNIYYRKLSEPTLGRFPDEHPWYGEITGSCIDLFTAGYPPGTFGELTANDYCLGRCEFPPIVNSGD